jgi:Tfp pilus assembly protein PilF
VRDDPKSGACRNNYGITRLRAGDPAAAREALQAAIQIDPRLPGPYYNLAILEKYYALDDAAAERSFGQYWERSHADPDRLAQALAPGHGPKDLAERKD